MVRSPFVPALLALVCAGCARNVREVAAPPLQPMPARAVMPQPPRGAAPNQWVPPTLADGSYATPSRGLSAAGTLWHLRAALNVAALGCADPDGALANGYNRMLTQNRTSLAEAHRALSREYADGASFDAAMTRLYNYYAQPPMQVGFCAEARSVLAEATALPPDTLGRVASDQLARLDRPFTDFYVAYDRYRGELSAWQRGGAAPPRLAYDARILLADTGVTGGVRQMAGR